MAGWPWPLDGVQHFFEGLWNWISQAAVNAVSVVSDWVWSAIGWLRDRVSEVGAWIWNQIKPVLGPIADWIAKVANWAWTQLFEFARDPVGYISRGVNWIGGLLNQVWTSLSGAVNQLGSWLGGALTTAKNTIVGGITGLATTISSAVGGAVNTLATAFNGAMSTVGSWLSDALAGVVKALGEALTGFIGWLQKQFNTLIGWLVGGIQWLGTQLRSVFEALASLILAPVTAALRPGSPPEPLGQITKDFGGALMNNIVDQCKVIHKSPAQRELAVGAGVAVLGGISLMHAAGGALGMAFDASHPAKEWGAQELYNRIVLNLMSSPVTSAILATPVVVGIITPMRQYFNAMFTPEVPGAGDLIRFVVREVIDTGTFYENMKWHGFSEFWGKAYWEAHWELPARGEVLDAFHRGVLSEGEKDKFMVWHDYKPEPRPGIGKSDLDILKGIEKSLIGRVDLRRGYELGRLSKSDLVERFRWLGYEDDAELIAEIQIRAAMDAEIGKLRDNAKADFVKGYIAEQDLRGTLEVLGYGPDVIEFHVQDAIQDRERSRKDRLVSNYVDAYVKGLIETEDELQARLSEVIVDPALVQAMVEDAYITRYKKPKAG